MAIAQSYASLAALSWRSPHCRPPAEGPAFAAHLGLGRHVADAPPVRIAHQRQPARFVLARGLLDDLRHSFSASFSSVDEAPQLVHSITEEEYSDFIGRFPGQLVVVDFYAEWCKPCKKITPLLTKMAALNPNVVFATYECDKARPALPKALGVTSFPTFLLYREGERIGMLKGVNSAGELMQVVAGHNKRDS
mmetsp:Transcript_19428/g.49901  ORF Transcript_19428/g.49901 Transcript_19428/m.49901 type:complete len:193 (-) Transcript_19428:88-666(-)